MRLSQTLEDDKYVYRVYLNGEEIHEVVNTQAEDFEDVKVYVSDPGNAAQPGYVRNLRIYGSGKYIHTSSREERIN